MSVPTLKNAIGWISGWRRQEGETSFRELEQQDVAIAASRDGCTAVPKGNTPPSFASHQRFKLS